MNHQKIKETQEMVLIKLVLDTNILHEAGLGSASMQRLTRLCKEFRVEINIPYIVGEEFKTKQVSRAIDYLSEINKNIESIKKTIQLTDEYAQELERFNNFCAKLKERADEIVGNEFADWAERTSAEVHPLQSYYVDDVFNSYFKGDGVFRKQKSREDIPDAFIMKCIEEILSILDDDEFLYVAIKDGFFKNYLSTIRNIKVIDSLNAFFELDQIKTIIDELDAESQRAVSIKAFLDSGEAKSKVYDFLMGDDTLEYQYLTEEEIVDPKKLLPEHSFSMSINGVNASSIQEIAFGSAKYNGEDSFSIDFEIDAIVSVSYVSSYPAYIDLDDKRKNQIVFQMTGDGWCDLSELIRCRINGSIDLVILEEMTPDKLEVHFRYLGTDESPIFIDPIFKNAELVSLG